MTYKHNIHNYVKNVKGRWSPVNISTSEVGIFEVGSSSVGAGTIAASETQVVVETTTVKPDSKVFVAATSSTRGQTPYVVEKKAGEPFTVKIDQPINAALTFDWWPVQLASAN